MRQRLPNRRPAQRLTFWFKGLEYSCGIGYYSNGDYGEIFISCGKSGSDAQILMLEAAVLASLLFQHGGKAKELHSAMPKTDRGEPEGPIGTLLELLAKAEAKDANEELLR